MSKLKKEEFYGNTEYKLYFVDMTKNKIDKYATQLKFRLIDGKGTALYFIGVSDDGHIIGIENSEINYHIEVMKQIANIVDSKVINIDINPVKDSRKKFLIIKLEAQFSLNELFIIDD